MDSVTIQHLITSSKRIFRHITRKTKLLLKVLFLHRIFFSQIKIGKEEKPKYNKGNINCLQKLNHLSRIENRSFSIPYVIFILKHPTNYFSALPCLYMQQNNWLVGIFFLFPAFQLQKKTETLNNLYENINLHKYLKAGSIGMEWCWLAPMPLLHFSCVGKGKKIRISWAEAKTI